MAWRISKIKFSVTRLNKDAHAKVSSIGTEIKNQCTGLFWKFWNQCHFLLENELYVYKESDMWHKELYLKKQLVTFFKELGYVGGFSHWMKPQINAWNDLLRTVCWQKPIWRKRKVIFSKPLVSLSSTIIIFITCNALDVLIIFICIYNEERGNNSPNE